MPDLILVVDDNVDLRETMAELLGLEGYQTVTASNGEVGLDVLSSLEVLPDLIISDWRMPEMDGEAFYRTLRAKPDFEHIPFILMGQFQSSASVHQLFPDAAFLDKPFNPNELINMVFSLLGQGGRS